MPPKKKPSIEDELKRYQEEMERKSQIDINRLIKLIEESHRISENKIKEIEEKCQEEINEMRKQLIEVETQVRSNTNQNNVPIRHVCEENQRNSNIEVSKPLFFGNNKDQHPIDFLQNLEEYFKIKQFNREEKLIVIRDCLKGTAGNWFATIKFQIKIYAEFRDAFIDEFWSREVQIQTLSNCLNTLKVPDNITYQEHFSQWSAKLRHLQVPQISEEEIVLNIANHYPGYIRAILISLPEKSIIAAMKILSTEEHRREKGESLSSENINNQYHCPQNKYNPKGQSKDNSHNNNNNWRNNQQSQNNKWNDNKGSYQTPHNSQNQPVSNIKNKQQINQVSIDMIEEQGETSNAGSNYQITHAVNNMLTNHKTVSPYIQCEMEGVSVQLLIDTGATISVLTQKIVDRIIHNNSKVPTLPINGVQISNAVGKKICKISKQIFCECKIGSARIFANFVQVENLNEKGIIGADILQQYNTQINFCDRTIIWEIDQVEHTTTFADTEPKELTKDQQIHLIQTNNNEEDDQTTDGPRNQEFLQLMNKYNFEKEMRFPPTLRCQIKEAAGVPSQTIDDFENETEDAIQIKIDSTEKATIEEQIPTSDNISHLAISNKKRKRELWAYQRNLARKIQKGLLTKKTTENPYSTLS